MYDLNSELEKWFERLKASKVYYNDDIDELRGHLQCEIESLCRLGLTEEEAFIVAKNRLGSEDALQMEYEKVNSDKSFFRAIYILLGGYFAVNAILGLISIGTKALLVISRYMGVNPDLYIYLIASVNVLLLVTMSLIMFRGRTTLGENIRMQIVRIKEFFQMHTRSFAVLIVIISLAGMLTQPILTRYFSINELGRVAFTASLINIVWWMSLAAYFLGAYYFYNRQNLAAARPID